MRTAIVSVILWASLFLEGQAAAAILIDFGNAPGDVSAATLGGTWNLVPWMGTSGSTSLVDDSNSATGLTLSYSGFHEPLGQVPWDSNEAWIDLEATRQLFAVSFLNPVATISVSGLDPNKTYQVDFLAARDSGLVPSTRVGDYRLNGQFADTVPDGSDFNAFTDGYVNRSILTWESVQGNCFILTIEASPSFAYATAMRITEIPEPCAMAIWSCLGLVGIAALFRRHVVLSNQVGPQ